jgi:hypothetical protein
LLKNCFSTTGTACGHVHTGSCQSGRGGDQRRRIAGHLTLDPLDTRETGRAVVRSCPGPSLAGLPAGAFEVANTLTQVGLYYTTAVGLATVALGYAAEHNDADEPFVVVAADHTGEMLDIAVADNGPGIPETSGTTETG